MKKKLLLVGGGGHCASVLDAAIRSDAFDEIGIVDCDISEFVGMPIDVVGSDNELKSLYQQGWNYAFVSVGSVGNTALRRKLVEKITNEGFIIPIICDPSAQISDYADIGKGTFVGKNAVINSRSLIGDFAIINTSAIVEHDCTIGDYVHVSPGTTICGNVCIGEDSHIGANSTIIQGIKIGKSCIIGAGAVVIHNILDNDKEVGNPSHKI